MLVQLRGSRLMGPAGLLPAMRAVALRLRRRGWTRRRIGVLTGPGRGLRPRRCRLSVAAGPAQLGDVPMGQRVRRAGSRRREQNRQKAVDATTELNEIIRSASLEPACEPRARLAAGSSGYTENRSGDLKPVTRLVVRSRDNQGSTARPRSPHGGNRGHRLEVTRCKPGR